MAKLEGSDHIKRDLADDEVWYVHSEGIHEGAYDDRDEAFDLAKELMDQGKCNVVVETRQYWLDREVLAL